MQSMKQFSHQISSLLILFMHFLLLRPGLQIQSLLILQILYLSISDSKSTCLLISFTSKLLLVGTKQEFLALTSV